MRNVKPISKKKKDLQQSRLRHKKSSRDGRKISDVLSSRWHSEWATHALKCFISKNKEYFLPYYGKSRKSMKKRFFYVRTTWRNSVWCLTCDVDRLPEKLISLAESQHVSWVLLFSFLFFALHSVISLSLAIPISSPKPIKLYDLQNLQNFSQLFVLFIFLHLATHK
jgi:hypothetical protein